jgi:hypothetical protein
MRPIIPILCLLLFAPALRADPAMTAEEFGAYTSGKTFYYGNDGVPYGAEEYLGDRRVIWSFLDGECQEGRWYEDNGLICFVYDTNPDPQCWSFRQSASGLIARFENDPSAPELYEVEQSRDPLICPGPEIGV